MPAAGKDQGTCLFLRNAEPASQPQNQMACQKGSTDVFRNARALGMKPAVRRETHAHPTKSTSKKHHRQREAVRSSTGFELHGAM